MRLRDVLFVALALGLAPAPAAARTRSPECVTPSKDNSDHKDECRRLVGLCGDHDAAACAKQDRQCGMVDSARYVDEVLKACGMPEAKAPPPPPEAPYDWQHPAAKAAAAPSAAATPTRRHGVGVYGRPGCPLCKRVIAELAAAGIVFTFHDIDQDSAADALVTKHHDYLHNSKLPLLMVDGKPVRFDYGNAAKACR